MRPQLFLPLLLVGMTLVRDARGRQCRAGPGRERAAARLAAVAGEMTASFLLEQLGTFSNPVIHANNSEICE